MREGVVRSFVFFETGGIRQRHHSGSPGFREQQPKQNGLSLRRGAARIFDSGFPILHCGARRRSMFPNDPTARLAHP
jgi:hypothetical protein